MTTITTVWSGMHNRYAYYDELENRLPETCILDLANLPRELNGLNAEEIIKIWNWAKDNIEQMIKSEPRKLFLVSRKFIETEIRVVSEKPKDLEAFRTKVLNKAIKMLNLTKRTDQTNILSDKKINREQLKDVLKIFQRDYEHFGPKNEYKDKFLLYSCDFATLGSVWKRLEKLGESFVFVAHSGVPYLLGFHQTTKNRNIFLTEFHLNGDPYRKYRMAPLDNKFITGLKKVTHLKSPVIIDRAYTGGTLLKLKNQFSNSKTVALFPKTLNSIKSCDYFIFNNKLFTKEDVDFSSKKWYFELLQKSLKRT